MVPRSFFRRTHMQIEQDELDSGSSNMTAQL